MATIEPIWQLSEIRNESGIMLIRKLLDALPVDGFSGSGHVAYLTFGCNAAPTGYKYYTLDDTATFAEIDDKDIPELESSTGALLVAAVSAPRVRDFIFYTDDPKQLLDAVKPLRSRYLQFEIGCECIPDHNWDHYCNLP